MHFDVNLSGKILDPIHGTIMITDIERQVISHPLFQRLRSVKQNSFLYKVFPSSQHSRFEHSLGVMHVAYQMYRHLVINSYRYNSKYNDKLLFIQIEKISFARVQELRLAALLHDIGHGPMSHQFDSFLLSTTQLKDALGPEFSDIYSLIDDSKGVEHEHISLIFIKKIFSDLQVNIEVDNIIKLIESSFKGGVINDVIGDEQYDIQPLFTSLISSCPIDSDRMDYLLRDSYFSGVKCGIYNIERIMMSIVPVVKGKQVYLAYKESGLDSISEFIFSRSSLFSQVYYHKTNRAFSSMLTKVCNKLTAKSDDDHLFAAMYQFKSGHFANNLRSLERFYLDNSDEFFIKHTLSQLIKHDPKAKDIIDNILYRAPWKKLYEAKAYQPNCTVHSQVNKGFVTQLKDDFSQYLTQYIDKEDFFIDVMSDNSLKDLDKTKVKLLTKTANSDYECHDIALCGEKLDQYQSVRYFIRVYVNPVVCDPSVIEAVNKLDVIKQTLVSRYALR